MWRVAIYGRETPGQKGQARLDRQVANLAAHIARQPGWRHVATYGDQGFGVGRPGLSRLVANAPDRVDLVVVDGYGRLSPNRREQSAAAGPAGPLGSAGRGAGTLGRPAVGPDGGEPGIG